MELSRPPPDSKCAAADRVQSRVAASMRLGRFAGGEMQQFAESNSAARGSRDHSMGDHSFEEHLLLRQYKHLINPAGGLDSLCTKCHMVIASEPNEWALLECEQQHACHQ